MLENPAVVTSTPVAAPQVSAPAPTPQADAAGQPETVNLNEHMAQKNAAKTGSGTPKATEKPAEKAPTNPPAQAEPQKEAKPQPEQPKMMSQQDFDTALGKRMAAERAKMERQAAPIRRIVELARQVFPGKTDEQLLTELSAVRNERMGWTPEQAALYDQLAQRGAPQQAEGGQEAQAGPQDAEAAADRLGREADEIEAFDKDFEINKFVSEHPEALPALRAGVSLKALYYGYNSETLIKAAKDEAFSAGQKAAVDNIRDRNNNTPTQTSPSAPATPTRDFSKMSRQEFKEFEAEAEKLARQGKRVVL